MYTTIFEKKYIPETLWIDNLIYNFQFYIPYTDSDILEQFKVYLSHCKQPTSHQLLVDKYFNNNTINKQVINENN